ncbi:DUF2889 domain-containing protein [Comamonas antarctica]|uniref:DUF2889 domain-containing protein n=1 Tax=Comamonas antarctica TaxID=2743470 RepID=A0A6N1X771_9BURK|nr:DUF2889 domain-containing protein [Comamonas antarctica]QKV53705.1 DUF2889 domain-containing protein [Comamonas antarctica]
MPLTEIPDRRPQHLRDVRYRSFSRPDGLWDIEGELHDSKAADQVFHGNRHVPAGTAIHHMWIRATVDTTLRVQAIEVAMDSHPLGHCPEANAALQRMVGCQMGRGWRKSIQEHLGGVASCTHLRELLFNMATAAFQSMPGVFAGDDPEQPPRHLGQCLGWDFNGPGVATYYPQFVHWDADARAARSAPADRAVAQKSA